MNKILRKILAEILAGMAQAMQVTSGRSYILPPEQAFRADAAALRRDARNIAGDVSGKFTQESP